jgi:hypothetical protein
MVGSYSFYKITENLLLKPKQQWINCLTHVGTSTQEGTNYTWKKYDKLGLEGLQKDEWINYTKGLVSV